MAGVSRTIGVDIGGTKIAAGLVADDGTVLEHVRVETPAEEPEEIGEAIAELVAGLSQGQEIAGIGVSAAGFIDVDRSTVMFAPNLAWRDEDLRSRLRRLTGLPVVVENDGNAAAWGEFRFGAAMEDDDLLMVAVGTGVGGGLVLDGELFRGSFGIAGEIGHIRVERDGRRCGCGQRGCLEQYGSGTALEERTREAITADADAAAALLERAGSAAAIEGEMITELAQQGDPFCIGRIADLGTWLGEGIAQIATVIDPGVVVLGGGVAVAGDLLLEPLRTAYAGHLTGGGHRPVGTVRAATLGNAAGMIGAADLARR